MGDERDLFVYPPAFLGAVEGIRKLAREEIGGKIREIVEISRRVRESLEGSISPIGSPERHYACVGVDSTWTTPHLELLYGDCALIIYGCLGENLREVRAEPVIYSGENFGSFLWRKSVELERKLATEILERVEVDLIIFDGNVFPFPIVYGRDWEEWSETIKATKELVKAAEEKGVSIVGVVKRVKSNYFSHVLGFEVPVNDKLLASLFLNRGEFVSVGKFGEFLPKYLRIVYEGRGEDYVRRFRETCDELPVGDVEVIFYKAKRSVQYDAATKVEVLDLAGMGVEKIVSVLASTSTSNGFPAVIDWIDEVVRNEHRVLSFLRDLLEKELMNVCSDEEKEVVMKICGFMNPQKSYLFRF